LYSMGSVILSQWRGWERYAIGLRSFNDSASKIVLVCWGRDN